MPRTLLTIVFLISVLSSRGQEVQRTLVSYFDKVRAGQTAEIPAVVGQSRRATDVFQILPLYLQDTVPAVRLKAYTLVRMVGTQTKEESLRRQGVGWLVNGVKDLHSGNAGVALSALVAFDKDAFSKDSRDSLIAIFRRKPAHLEKFIRLLGYLELNKVRDDLRQIAQQKDYARKDRWAALLALARMGDEYATEDVLRRVKKLPVTDEVVYDIFPDLIYTRQKQLTDILVEALKSDVKNCSSADAEQAARIPCGYRIMEMLAPVVENYPLNVDASGDIDAADYTAALQTVRDWFKKYPDYKILSDRY